ncbi:hypothetical protein niasHS_001371 [Heterodera schachtii]|uniref:Apple domain-containing protein n=1 Tax=Heterodera schachtii TaxID=97005 RepID=A0ABD2KLE5_HETSC
MRSSASPARQLLAFCSEYCSNSSSSSFTTALCVVVLLLLLFPAHCPTCVAATVEIGGEFKHCFERYAGHRIVAASPFLSEWRRSSEEQCLEFCVRSSSRCGAIVYDKGGHICHYFISSDSPNLVRQRKFVYLRVTDRNCTDSLKVKLLAKESRSKMPKNADGTSDGKGEVGTKLATTVKANKNKMTSSEKGKHYAIPEPKTTRTTSVGGNNLNATDYYEARGRSSNSAVPTIGALLAELDDELAKRTQMALPSPSQAANAIEDEAVLLDKLAKKGPLQSEREIRRSPRINDRGGGGDQKSFWPLQNAKMLMEMDDQQQFNEMIMSEKEGRQHMAMAKGEDNDSEQSITAGGENPCDNNSGLTHRIWLAVENARLASAVSDHRMPQKAANTPRECVRVCTNLLVGLRPCNSFTFYEHEKHCVFGHSGNAFPSHEALESIRNGDFSQRTFRQFCYPASLPPFENCAEFLAFYDYRLETEPREVFDGLPGSVEGLSACIELCVLSSDFRCMSASFDYMLGICRLFHEHSLSNPKAFREHHNKNQLYFENGCVESAGEITEETSQMGSVRRMRKKI